ncbi:MAG TPA: hypothetical protein VK609_07595 [Mucilaginibacter sp.]|nr:hypothetical protein [Mucilaginibacter sp.]
MSLIDVAMVGLEPCDKELKYVYHSGCPGSNACTMPFVPVEKRLADNRNDQDQPVLLG